MKNLFYYAPVASKKTLLIGVVMASVILCFTACGGSTRMTRSTSTYVDLAQSVRIIPSIANLEVQPTRVTATADAMELESLDERLAKQTVVAKALATTVSGDIMLAPHFFIERNPEGKMTSISVSGYAAQISSFRPMTEADVVFCDSLLEKQQVQPQMVAFNTMTVADVEYGAKMSISLAPAELAGQNEASALQFAKEKLLRQEKVDVLFGEQYSISINDGNITSFTLTAFPGKYANYRKTTLREQLALKPTLRPVVNYQTIAADVAPIAPRAQLKFGTGNAVVKEEDLKETARAAALQKYNADFLLNETFYFDYSGKIITHVTICGTPAVYTNFRPYNPLMDEDVVDVKLVPMVGDVQEVEKPKSLWETFIGLFKKK